MTTATSALVDLVASWRTEAERLESWGAIGQATTLRTAAGQLEARLRAESDAVLTLSEAAATSGYSRHHLAREVRAGRLPNLGRKHAPRVRLADLPRKPGHLPRPPVFDMISGARGRAVRAVVHPETGG